MKRLKKEPLGSKRLKLSHLLLGLSVFYLIYALFKFTMFVEVAKMLSLDDSDVDKALSMLVVDNVEGEVELNKSLFKSVHKDASYEKVEDNVHHNAPAMSHKEPRKEETNVPQTTRLLQHRYGRITSENLKRMNRTNDLSVLENMVDEAWTLGVKAWKEVDNYNLKDMGETDVLERKREACPSWVSINGDELAKGDNLMFLPCGLAAGSSITVVATPRHAHKEKVPQVARSKTWADTVMVSQFTVELQGLKSVDGEDPPKILHLNPRLKGDWIHRPVIEHNTCYRMQWGAAQRCDGKPSKKEDDMFVDGFLRCERWIQNDIVGSKDSKTTSWFKRFIGREQKPEVTWPFPFVEGRLFILTIRAGVEGYHINIGGRHVTSFPYRMGFALEDATGLYIKGDLDVHSVYASALPSSHPSFSPQGVLEMAEKWKANSLPMSSIRLFIGVLSSTNHFAERMAVRKTWMQSSAIKSSDVVVRFFVALNPRKAVNVVLKKEASYFGDIVIIPFMDRYELVVLKTIAICEFGVKNVTASYIMKCDDDTFVRVNTVLKEIDGISTKRPLYMGNLNLLHRPLRFGKWAVTYKEWPEEAYPPYANGPGYIISGDVAEFIVSHHRNQTLRLFKMEDVSMGMWVEQFNSSKPVQYSHSWKFCQYGCMEDYYTAHYQSPRQMFCLWDKIARGRAQCCNFR